MQLNLAGSTLDVFNIDESELIFEAEIISGKLNMPKFTEEERALLQLRKLAGTSEAEVLWDCEDFACYPLYSSNAGNGVEYVGKGFFDGVQSYCSRSFDKIFSYVFKFEGEYCALNLGLKEDRRKEHIRLSVRIENGYEAYCCRIFDFSPYAGEGQPWFEGNLSADDIDELEDDFSRCFYDKFEFKFYGN